MASLLKPTVNFFVIFLSVASNKADHFLHLSSSGFQDMTPLAFLLPQWLLLFGQLGWFLASLPDFLMLQWPKVQSFFLVHLYYMHSPGDLIRSHGSNTTYMLTTPKFTVPAELSECYAYISNCFLTSSTWMKNRPLKRSMSTPVPLSAVTSPSDDGKSILPVMKPQMLKSSLTPLISYI